MQLWLVRHAVAAEREEFDGPDAERPLTAKGRRRFGEFCDWVATQTAIPSTIVTSPLVRAAQTAAILAKSAGLKKSEIITSDLLCPGVDVKQLVQFACNQAAEYVALVGHEPDMSRILADVIGGGSVRFGKGCIAAVEFDGLATIGAGRLCWFFGPKLLKQDK